MPISSASTVPGTWGILTNTDPVPHGLYYCVQTENSVVSYLAAPCGLSGLIPAVWSSAPRGASELALSSGDRGSASPFTNSAALPHSVATAWLPKCQACCADSY